MLVVDAPSSTVEVICSIPEIVATESSTLRVISDSICVGATPGYVIVTITAGNANGPAGDYHDLGTLVGIDVDLTGVVRVLPDSQKSVRCRGEVVLESKCQDWDLPVLPNAQANWPPVSMTVVRISDRGTSGNPKRSEGRTLADTGLDAAAADGKPVRALGQFRGANLCKDLPEASRHDPADWVLHTAEGPVWVTGRRPAGNGFQLDAAYRGDTTRWLEVSGKVLILDNVRYLKASKVALIPRPPEAEPDAGTTFTWAARTFGPRTGWMGGWAIVVADIIVNLSLILNPGLILLGGEIGSHPVLIDFVQKHLEGGEFAVTRIASSPPRQRAVLWGCISLALEAVPSVLLPQPVL
jgi:hypothetical protein